MDALYSPSHSSFVRTHSTSSSSTTNRSIYTFSSLPQNLSPPCPALLIPIMSSSLAIASHGADLLPFRRRSPKALSSVCTITINLDSRYTRKKGHEWSIRISIPPPAKLILATNDNNPSLKFSMLELPVKELKNGKVVGFDQYVVREAEQDEELWEAAWLRAESQSDDRVNERYAHSHKKKFAEQELNALKKQCKGHHGLTFKCIVAVKKELDIKHGAMKRVLGTLDLNIRYLLPGETFPGERVRAPLFSKNYIGEKIKYAYVANVCVAEPARRQGIASNMMHLAIKLTRINGLTGVYVHVHRKNVAAQEMYQKLGFEMVETAIPQLSAEKIYLLFLKM